MMKAKTTDLIMDNKIFIWGGIATLVLLMFPYLAMVFNWQVPDPGAGTDGVNWSTGDFIMMGVLLYGTGSAFVITARKAKMIEQRLVLGLIFLFLFLAVWDELAVGAVSQIISRII